MKRHIPNFITCCNLLSGAIAIVFAFRGNFQIAFLAILLGAVFDFFDGMSARLLHVSNPIGKELDSLADVITFGLAPTFLLYIHLHSFVGAWAFAVLPMAAFSALRLAKFNLDERQTTSFIGLATPANAIFWASAVCFLGACDIRIVGWIAAVIIVMSFVSCYLLISEIPFFSLKFHDLSWNSNKVRYIFLCGALLILVLSILFSVIWGAGAFVIVWYILLSLVTIKNH